MIRNDLHGDDKARGATLHDLVPTPELRACPGCGARARVTDRFVLRSCCGPLEAVTVSCAAGHSFAVLVEDPIGASAHVAGEPDRWTSRVYRAPATRRPGGIPDQ